MLKLRHAPKHACPDLLVRLLAVRGRDHFDVTQPTEATLIFQKDDPSGINVLAEHPVAVVLLPSGE